MATWQAHFSTLARHNAWATKRLLHAVAALDGHAYRQDVGLFFRSIHGTFNHVLVAGHLLWRRRFVEGVSPQVALDGEAESDRMRLADRLLEGVMHWQPLIESGPPKRLEGTLDCTTMRGRAVSLPFAATLAHVFNHATHHRGQITAALAALGQPCPELDLIYMLQEESQTP